MGEHTLRIPMTLHAENRERLRTRLLAHADTNAHAPGTVVLLQGGDDTSRYSADAEHVFHQVI